MFLNFPALRNIGMVLNQSTVLYTNAYLRRVACTVAHCSTSVRRIRGSLRQQKAAKKTLRQRPVFPLRKKSYNISLSTWSSFSFSDETLSPENWR